MNVPDNLYYTKDHEWVRLENGIATIGITDYAQSELGDIIYFEFPDIGFNCRAGDTIGTIEAVKTVADLYSPLKGMIKKINSTLESKPELVNIDPYDTGWILKLDKIDEGQPALLSANEYKIII